MKKIMLIVLLVVVAFAVGRSTPKKSIIDVPPLVADEAAAVEPPVIPDVVLPFVPTPDPISTPAKQPAAPTKRAELPIRNACPGGVCRVPSSGGSSACSAPVRRFRLFRR